MSEKPLLTGAAMAGAAGFDIALTRATVLVFDAALMPRRARKPRQRHPFRKVSALRQGVDMVCAAGPGAPSAAVAVEFLAAFGVETVVGVGTAGDLGGSLPATAHPVAAAVSDEGTSKHYGPDLTADITLTERLAEAAGQPPLTTLTTDVPFRHTARRLEEHRRVAEVVEMECAAIFAASRAFGIRAASLLVISDRFDSGGWRMRDRAAVTRDLDAAVAIAAAEIGR